MSKKSQIKALFYYTIAYVEGREPAAQNWCAIPSVAEIPPRLWPPGGSGQDMGDTAERDDKTGKEWTRDQLHCKRPLIKRQVPQYIGERGLVRVQTHSAIYSSYWSDDVWLMDLSLHMQHFKSLYRLPG